MNDELESEIRNKRQFEEEYDPCANAETIAKKRGLIVSLPDEDELQIDIDSIEQKIEFHRRLEYFYNCPDDNLYFVSETITPSPSEKPGRFHARVKMNRAISTEERLLLQAALYDDPLRVFMNASRYMMKDKNPSRLFEKPDFTK